MVMNNKENSLIERKRINNTSSLPQFDDGSESLSASNLLNMIGKIQNRFPQQDAPVPFKDVLMRVDIPSSPQIAEKKSALDERLEGITTTKEDIDRAKASRDKSSFGDVAEKIGMGVQAVSSLAGNLANTANSYKTKEQFLAEARRGQSQIGGVSYETMSPNYKCGKMPKYMDGTQGAIGGLASGAAAGSMFGPIGMGVGAVAGGILGGIFGNSAKKKEQEQKRLAELSMSSTNDFNRSVAHTAAMINQQALKYGNSESQNLYGYNCGKMPKYYNGKVYSPFGPINAAPDSKVSKGEVAIDLGSGSMFRIPTGPNDTALFAGGKDPDVAIITNKYGLSDYAMVDPMGALEMQKVLKDSGKLKKNNLGYASGKISAWPGAAVAGLGALTGLAQYLGAKKETPYRPNTYYDNPYENSALSTLAGIRMNELPIINQLRSAEARGNYALNNSGGLSGAQRYLGKIANIRNTQDSIAQALAQLQQQNNQYRTNYASTLMQAGAQKAANLAAARRYDDDVYMKSHVAKKQGEQIGIYDILNNLQRYVANEFNRRQFNNTYDLYAQDLNLRKMALNNKTV